MKYFIGGKEMTKEEWDNHSAKQIEMAAKNFIQYMEKMTSDYSSNDKRNDIDSLLQNGYCQEDLVYMPDSKLIVLAEVIKMKELYQEPLEITFSK